MGTTNLGVGSDSIPSSNVGEERTLSPVSVSLLVFAVERLYALDIELVERVIRAVEIRPLPGGPEIVAGLLNVRGSLLPVVDLRVRFGLFKRKPRLDDHLILMKSPLRLALRVDLVHGVISRPVEEIMSVDAMMSRTKYFEKAVPLDGEIVLIQDLGRLLSPTEESAANEAIRQNTESIR